MTTAELAVRMGTTVGPQREPRERFVTVDGLRLHLLEWGPDDAPPLLLLHSGEETAHSWDLVGCALSGEHRVIALDSRGCGESERVEDGVYLQEDLVRDVEGVVAALGLRDPVVAGQAWGARHAFLFAAAHPEAVRAAVIVDTAPEVDPRATADVHAYLRATSAMPSFAAFVARLCAENPLRDPAYVEAMLRHEVQQQADGTWGWRRDLRGVLGTVDPARQTPMSTPAYQWEALARVRCPALVVHGAHSPFVSAAMAERVRATLPDGRLVTLHEAGHLAAGDAPAAFERALREFLSSLDG